MTLKRKVGNFSMKGGGRKKYKGKEYSESFKIRSTWENEQS